MADPSPQCNIQVPDIIAQRAIDAAFSLTEDYADRLDLAELVLCHTLIRGNLDQVSWWYAGTVMALHSAVVERRV